VVVYFYLFASGQCTGCCIQRKKPFYLAYGYRRMVVLIRQNANLSGRLGKNREYAGILLDRSAGVGGVSPLHRNTCRSVHEWNVL